MLTNTDVRAIVACFATRGAHKGMLLKKAPPMVTDAYAAWQAMMLSWNPYKASIGGIMFLAHEQRGIFDRVSARADANPQLRGLQRDRLKLETLGAW